MAAGQITTLTKANKASDSLRTTVPASIIRQFELKEGDRLIWKLEAEKNGTIYVKIDHIKNIQ